MVLNYNGLSLAHILGRRRWFSWEYTIIHSVKKKRVPSIVGEGGTYSSLKVLKSYDKINLNSSTSKIILMPQAKFICNIKYYFLLHFGSYRPIDVQDCISEEALCKSSLINTHGMESQFITFIYTSHWFHFVVACRHRFRILLMHVYLCLYKNLYIYILI